MDQQSISDESILFADLAQIRKMADAFRKLEAQHPRQYFRLPTCDAYENVENGGPPLQIDREMFAIWSRGIGTRCPVMLHHLMNFLQPRVAFNANRKQPISKRELQPHLRVHAGAFLMASPVTSKMTI